MIGTTAVREVCTRLEKCGYEAFLVGGCVRDLIRGKLPKDYDLVTNASPTQLQQLFPGSFGTGASFRVTRLVQQGEAVEIAAYRKDVYPPEGSSKPAEVLPVQTLEEDLQRRDFTINAMAMDIRGNIRDPLDGRSDLQAAVLRATHPQAFREDPVRILRGCKFVGRDNLHIEPSTWQLMKEAAPRLQHVPAERVQKELLQTLLSRHAGRALVEWRRLGLLPWILPELAAEEWEHWNWMAAAIDLTPTDQMRSRAALLGSSAGCAAIVRRLGLPHKEISCIQFLADNYLLPFRTDRHSVRQWLDSLEISGWELFAPMLKELTALSVAVVQAKRRTGECTAEGVRQAADKLRAIKQMQGQYPLGPRDLPFTGKEFALRGVQGREVGSALVDAVNWMRVHGNEDWEGFWRRY